LRDEVWQVLAPLPREVPTDDAKWLRDVEAALAAAPLPASLTGALVDRLRTMLGEHRWAALVAAVAHAWPDRPAPLHDGRVLGRLGQLAERATRRQLPTIRRDTLDDAPGVILEAFAKFDRTQPFNPWAERVLHNYAV